MLKRAVYLFCAYFICLIVTFVSARSLYLHSRQANFFKNVMTQISEISMFADGNDFGLLGKDQESIFQEFGTKDIRVANLKYFFRKYSSPLYDFAEEFVKAADANSFDYRLLPAIAMQESNLCKYIPENSYNCWGWGIYGGKVTRFASYSEAIDTISRGIKMYYIDKGLKTPEDIMRKYTPPSDGSWAHGVNTFLKIIE